MTIIIIIRIQDTGTMEMVIFDRIQSAQIQLLIQRILNNVLFVTFVLRYQPPPYWNVMLRHMLFIQQPTYS